MITREFFTVPQITYTTAVKPQKNATEEYFQATEDKLCYNS